MWYCFLITAGAYGGWQWVIAFCLLDTRGASQLTHAFPALHLALKHMLLLFALQQCRVDRDPACHSQRCSRKTPLHTSARKAHARASSVPRHTPSSTHCSARRIILTPDVPCLRAGLPPRSSSRRSRSRSRSRGRRHRSYSRSRSRSRSHRSHRSPPRRERSLSRSPSRSPPRRSEDRHWPPPPCPRPVHILLPSIAAQKGPCGLVYCQSLQSWASWARMRQCHISLHICVTSCRTSALAASTPAMQAVMARLSVHIGIMGFKHSLALVLSAQKHDGSKLS